MEQKLAAALTALLCMAVQVPCLVTVSHTETNRSALNFRWIWKAITYLRERKTSISDCNAND